MHKLVKIVVLVLLVSIVSPHGFAGSTEIQEPVNPTTRLKRMVPALEEVEAFYNYLLVGLGFGTLNELSEDAKLDLKSVDTFTYPIGTALAISKNQGQTYVELKEANDEIVVSREVGLTERMDITFGKNGKMIKAESTFTVTFEGDLYKREMTPDECVRIVLAGRKNVRERGIFDYSTAEGRFHADRLTSICFQIYNAGNL